MILSASATFAVSMMIGNRCASRMRRQSAKPSMSGSITSSIAKSSRFDATQASASAAVPHLCTA